MYCVTVKLPNTPPSPTPCLMPPSPPPHLQVLQHEGEGGGQCTQLLDVIAGGV